MYQKIDAFLSAHIEAVMWITITIFGIIVLFFSYKAIKFANRRNKEYLNKIIDERITKMQEKQGTDKQAESQPQERKHFMTRMEYDRYKRERGIK